MALCLSVGSLVCCSFIYSLLWGAHLGVGLVLGMCAHELGHLLMLRRYGVPAAWPVFVPFVGAAIRANLGRASHEQRLRIALAGPLAGLGCAALCLIAWPIVESDFPLWLGLILAALNLFDLIPAGPLDGGRARDAHRDLTALGAAAYNSTKSPFR